MRIKLKRAFDPDEIEGEWTCGLCECRFEAESVRAAILEVDWGPACRACLDYLSERNPGKFPSVAELEAAIQRYPHPVYDSIEEIMRLEQADDPTVREAYIASWLTRAAS